MVQKVKHPSWRVYKALNDCGLSLRPYELAEGIDVYYPYEVEDELTGQLKLLLTDKLVEDTFGIEECHRIFSDVYDRQVLEGMLLNGKTPSEISNTLGILSETILTYSALFFDVTVFKNEVEKLVYVRKGTWGCDQKAKLELKERGEEFLKASRGIGSDKLSIEAILTEMLAKSYVKYMTNADSDPFTAQGWANISARLAGQLMKKNGSGATLADFFVDLVGVEAPKTTRDQLK